MQRPCSDEYGQQGQDWSHDSRARFEIYTCENIGKTRNLRHANELFSALPFK